MDADDSQERKLQASGELKQKKKQSYYDLFNYSPYHSRNNIETVGILLVLLERLLRKWFIIHIKNKLKNPLLIKNVIRFFGYTDGNWCFHLTTEYKL